MSSRRSTRTDIRAGADVIITNTFSAGRTVLADSGHENDYEQINLAQ